jgi:hypothetical protein
LRLQCSGIFFGKIKLSNDFVTVELETDKPYEHYEEHAEKYPPGQMKKGNTKKGNKWAKK